MTNKANDYSAEISSSTCIQVGKHDTRGMGWEGRGAEEAGRVEWDWERFVRD